MKVLFVAEQISKDLPEAFSILGYGFYLQPMMLPLLAEMPPGSLGVQLTNQAMCLVTLGNTQMLSFTSSEPLWPPCDQSLGASPKPVELYATCKKRPVVLDGMQAISMQGFDDDLLSFPHSQLDVLDHTGPAEVFCRANVSWHSQVPDSIMIRQQFASQIHGTVDHTLDAIYFDPSMTVLSFAITAHLLLCEACQSLPDALIDRQVTAICQLQVVAAACLSI